MNKTAIKNYAVDARKKWIQAIAQQAALYGCTQSDALNDADLSKQLADKGIYLTTNEKAARSELVKEINSKGYKNAIEEVAYTWFNRLIAIRFMEVNGYLPSGIRILSSVDGGRVEPDCIRDYARLDFLNQETAAKLAAQSDESLYRYILVEQCNALGRIMPGMFTHIGGIAALLLPERLYIKDGLVHDLTHAIGEEDFGEQVEIIGWLYQYYISEKKDEVFAALKKNVKITRENIPAATQLFTPDWIVKYMVENSLGRLWLERQPPPSADGTPFLEGGFGWKYYIDEAEQEPEVRAQLDTLIAQNPINSPEDITLIDPCMGSGHILVYAFDVLHQIYAGQGYAERDIPDLILKNNIFGLDIDERACQLAYFALMMKARSYNRRFFRREDVPQPQVYSPQGYEEGMEYGSLVKVEELEERPSFDAYTMGSGVSYEVSLNTWNFRRLLARRYDVVVTNPPYMGSSGMGARLAEFVKKHYPDSKSDLFAVFIEKCGEMLNKNGYQAMITQHSWMFLSSYEKLRMKLMRRSIINMAHLGARAFDEIGGEVVQTTVFVIGKRHINDYEATYVRLVDLSSQQAKEDAFLAKENRCAAKQENYDKISGKPIAYWVSGKIFKVFANTNSLNKYYTFRRGITTADNDRFLRLWHEVNYKSTNIICMQEAKWYKYNKGGGFRKWFGNQEYVVLWANNGYALKHFKNSAMRNLEYNFVPNVSYSSVGGSTLAFRKYDYFINDQAGNFYTAKNRSISINHILGLLNSKQSDYFVKIKNATLNTTADDLNSIPIPTLDDNISILVDRIVSQCLVLSKSDWDAFETSWDFQAHPLIELGYSNAPLVDTKDIHKVEPIHMYYKETPYGRVLRSYGEPNKKIKTSWDEWVLLTDTRFTTLKTNEEALNRIFIDIYGLQDELTPEVADKDVTVRRADLGRDIRSFVSYAVGCMFGRYSLDTPGLAYAGGAWDAGKYTSYIPEDDNILPITDADYFSDDIVTRFVDFVKVVYGEHTLAENLDFIANALYPNVTITAREAIRRYFLSDFFKDHCKVYQKRPIYWLFDSGKQNGFKALIYLHRYDKYTVARVRTEYLHPLQRKYEAEIERMNKLTDLPESSARDKAAFKKQTEKIAKQIAECRAYDPIIAHIAAQTIELDLDDGVKVNYERFQGVEVPRGDGMGTVRMDLLGKV